MTNGPKALVKITTPAVNLMAETLFLAPITIVNTPGRPGGMPVGRLPGL